MFRAGCSDAGSGAGATNEGKQKAFVPPPAGRAGRVPREVFLGKCRIPPAGFASRGRVVSPRRETRRPPWGRSRRPPAALRAARGRGLPRFCRLHHVGPLRPVPGTVRNPIRAGAILCVTSIQPSRATPAETFAFRPARVPRNLLPRYNPRALLEIKDNRFPLHKHSVSTYPFPLIPAFLQPSASREMSAISRPDLPPSRGGQGEYSRRGGQGPPLRANLFRLLFRSLGKVAPAERNKQFLIAKNHKQNFNAPA